VELLKARKLVTH